LADEIVAVDSGSTDGTIALLERHGARVISSEWKGHVATKQMALEACGEPWVLCLDSDESLDGRLAGSVRETVARDDPALGGCRVNRKVWYLGGYLNHAWQPEWRLRLVRRGSARWTGSDPHDRLELTRGRSLDLAGTLRHDSFERIADHFRAQAQHARVAAESIAGAGGRGSYCRLMGSPVGAFMKQMVLKSAWRDGARGWAAAASTAAGSLMKHAILIELTRTGRD